MEYGEGYKEINYTVSFFKGKSMTPCPYDDNLNVGSNECLSCKHLGAIYSEIHHVHCQYEYHKKLEENKDSTKVKYDFIGEAPKFDSVISIMSFLLKDKKTTGTFIDFMVIKTISEIVFEKIEKNKKESKMQNYYKIGETFEYEGNKYIVVKSSGCVGCDLREKQSCNGSRPLCGNGVRADKTSVIFKLVKETKVKKPLFENEAEVQEFFKECIPVGISDDFREVIKHYMREYGYIKKSVVDEAEEEYLHWNYSRENHGICKDYTIMNKLYQAIQELKKQLKEIK